MSVTQSSATDIGLQGFERQNLKCPKCGDTDSRFVLISAALATVMRPLVEDPSGAVDAGGRAPAITQFVATSMPTSISDRRSTLARAELNLDLVPGFDDFINDVARNGMDDPSHHPEGLAEKVLSEASPRHPQSRAVGANPEASLTFSEVLQSYMAKWRQARSAS